MEDHNNDINYDLVALLQVKMNTLWRLKNCYQDDAAKANCHSQEALKQICADEERHIEVLKAELKNRIANDLF